ncbi:hypothetical protein OHB12_33135 [Nocardia sp. NBC_01730]|uniref:hypothetical protein n=1 Tax=Nocardia sp. NBC_01730 TaxID=2975998 RepID=UPI002E10560D|nr:hypothetical protein OHB12_33135 [Nocardia sp. NBC_01730]
MAKGFKINREGIRRMTREIEKEFAKNPVRVPLEADPDGIYPPAATVTNYNGPVVTVTGDHAQLAWNNDTVNQGQARRDEIAPGYERLAATLANLLAELARLPLNAEDSAEVRGQAEAVLAEVVNEEPNPGIVKRGLTMIKGLLSPIAAGITQAATTAATEEGSELARDFIHSLGEAAPF